MLAVVYHGPDNLQLSECPIPEVGSDEALIRVKSAGICGTDLRIASGLHRQYPPGTVRIPGHEVVGDVVETGGAVQGVEVGQRVFVAPNMGCGRCRQCVTGHNNRCKDTRALGVTMDGAFAEYMRVPADAIRQGNIIPVRTGMDPAAAAMIEPLACVLRGQRAVGVGMADLVLIIGAGPIGILHLMLARSRGVRRVLVSDFMAERLELALGMGADRVIQPGEELLADVVEEESGGEGAQVILVAAPSPEAQEEALELAGTGGRINFFGGLPRSWPHIRFDSNRVHYQELMVTGTTGCSTRDCQEAAALANSGRIDPSALISARFPLKQFEAAFAAARQGHSLKIVLEG